MSAFSLCVTLLGALALFLFGMTYMSEALQRAAGKNLRHILARCTSNSFKAILTGTFITSVIQSSSATTVMVVSFVNAGLLNLRNAIGLILGANIGTTVTSWIVTFLGIKYSIPTLPIIGLGFLLMMYKGKKVNQWGEFFIGFGLLFLGLDFLQNSIKDLDLANNAAFISYIQSFVSGSGSIGFGSLLLFFLIGTVLTVILQSSSAMMALTIVLCAQNIIPFEIAAALVLGENLGTTVTANIAAAVGNIAAKRAARAHFIINVISAFLMLIFFFPFVHGIALLTEMMEGSSPYVAATSIPIALCLFHTIYNILKALLLVWFIPQIEKATKYLVAGAKDGEDEGFRLRYIEGGYIKMGELALESAKNEVHSFGERMVRMFEFIPTLMTLTYKEKEYDNLLKRTQNYEQISDRMEIEIANYLSQMSAAGVTPETSRRITGMLSIIDNLESIGDQNFQLAKQIENKNENNIEFTPEMNANLNHMIDLVRSALNVMLKNLEKPYLTVDIAEALAAENAINEYRDKLRSKHLDDINSGKYTYQQGIAYSGMYALLEKLGDHIINISEALVNTKVTADANII
ncbi:MAG: Na/Pi cotransporter family protein [Bacteroidales bacterium]|nr:Na/Pi cotransporter family protein [Bacteroidales bacterium]